MSGLQDVDLLLEPLHCCKQELKEQKKFKLQTEGSCDDFLIHYVIRSIHTFHESEELGFVEDGLISVSVSTESIKSHSLYFLQYVNPPVCW